MFHHHPRGEAVTTVQFEFLRTTAICGVPEKAAAGKTDFCSSPSSADTNSDRATAPVDALLSTYWALDSAFPQALTIWAKHRAVLPKLQSAISHLEGLLNTASGNLSPRGSHLAGLGWDPKICISNKFSDGTEATNHLHFEDPWIISRSSPGSIPALIVSLNSNPNLTQWKSENSQCPCHKPPRPPHGPNEGFPFKCEPRTVNAHIA